MGKPQMSTGRDRNKNYAAPWIPKLMKDTEKLFKSRETQYLLTTPTPRVAGAEKRIAPKDNIETVGET